MNRILLLLPLLFCFQAQAVTKATFFGLQTMIQIIPTDNFGSSDTDSVELYRAMNVPIQDSVMGPGKAIVAANKALNFVCGIRNNSIYECSIVIQRSPYTKVDPFKKTLRFEMTGAEAEEIRLKFYLNQQVFSFKSTDNVLRVDAQPEHFVLEYDASGVN